MTARTLSPARTPARTTTPAGTPTPARTPAGRPPVASAADRALDEALEHISDLAERLWAVRRTHAPVRTRTLLGGERLRCAGCGHPSPCPTLQAADPQPGAGRR